MPDSPPPAPRRAEQYRNWLSLSGAVVATGSLFSFVLLFAFDLFAHGRNPYMGILAYVVAPAFFFIGLVLFILGGWVHRRRTRKGSLPHPFTIDLSRSRDKRIALAFIIGAVAFLLVSAVGSYNTYHYTESVNFCGQACHVPMKPEYTAYLNSSHARVACTECHVGPGAESYIKSKINGVHQLYCVATDSYHRPIKSPIKNMRPAQETCEQCHWPREFVGNLDRTYSHFLSDETNTPFSVRLLLKVGGADPSHGPVGGIHWHMSVANMVEYIATDDQRQSIPWVRVTSKDGTVTEFKTKAFTDDPAKHTIRKMDCMDCHNRPAHDFSTPNDAVDLAMTLGTIDSTLPWAKSNVVAALIPVYPTQDVALQKISATLRAEYPNYGKVDALVSATQEIYQRNFFPEMKSDWRQYPNNLGHKNWLGCFRCHDGLHKTSDGKQKIEASSCNACHIILAQGSGADMQKLNATGYNFFHIDSEMNDFSCNNCHTGAFTK